MTTTNKRNVKHIREYLTTKLNLDCFDSINEYNVYVEGLNGVDSHGYYMDKPFVYSQHETLINLDTATDDALISIESLDLLYVIRGKEVLIFRWFTQEYNEWEKIMGERFCQI